MDAPDDRTEEPSEEFAAFVLELLLSDDPMTRLIAAEEVLRRMDRERFEF